MTTSTTTKQLIQLKDEYANTLIKAHRIERGGNSFGSDVWILCEDACDDKGNIHPAGTEFVKFGSGVLRNGKLFNSILVVNSEEGKKSLVCFMEQV